MNGNQKPRPWEQLCDYEVEQAQALFRCPDCGSIIGSSVDANSCYDYCPKCGRRRRAEIPY